MTTSVESQGTSLRRGDGGGPEVFAHIAQITNIAGPSGSAPVSDVSTLDSVAREKRMGLPDEGQVSFGLIWDPANVEQEALRLDRKNRVQRNFRIVFSDLAATTFNFAAFVTEFSFEAPVDDVIKGSLTLEITGALDKV